MQKDVILSNKKDRYFKGSLIAEANKNTALLSLAGSEIGEINVTAGDFFNGLIKLREILEQKDLFILCYGSVVNVYPSRMSSQMSNGVKAYKLALGKQALLTDVVNIFDLAPENEVGTIREQRDFFDRWIEGFRK